MDALKIQDKFSFPYTCIGCNFSFEIYWIAFVNSIFMVVCFQQSEREI